MSPIPKKAGPDPDVIPLRLPEIPDEGQPGSRFVRRSVGMTLTLVTLLAATALLVASIVRMDVTVKAAGVLEPVGLYPVRALEGGPVREVLVQTGDTVRRGQVLIRMDTVELTSSLAQLEAQLRAAEIDRQRSATADPLQREQNLQRAAQTRQRLAAAMATLRQRMVEYDLGTNADSLLAAYVPGTHVTLDQAVSEVRSAQAELRVSGAEGGLQELSRFDREKLGTQMDQLRAQIAAVRARLRQLTIAAPVDGVVLTEQLERLNGAFVREGEQLMELGGTMQWRVQLNVTERDVHKVHVGDSVKVELPAFDQSERQLLGGRVDYVAPEPLSLQGAQAGGGQQPGAAQAGGQAGPGVYRITATLDRSQLEKMGIENFRRGYSVQGNVITKSGRIITLLWNYLTEKLGK